MKNLKIKNIIAAVLAALVVLALLKMGCNGSKTSSSAIGNTVHWKMATTWSDNLPLLQSNIELMAKEIELVTNGRLVISFVDPLSIS